MARSVYFLFALLFHILAGGQTVCTFDATRTNVFEYYHSDHLRSTSVLTDQTGTRVQHHEYSAFGRDRFTESTTAFPMSRRYTSQILDEDTGLYYYNARYYDPQLARFIQPDTILPDLSNPQSFNRYTYTLNNPLRYTDPTGHEPDEDDVPLTPRAQRAALARGDAQAQATQQGAFRSAKAFAAGAGEVAKLNPIYRGHEALSSVDSTQGNRKMGGWERAGAGVDAGAGTAAKVLKVGAVTGAAIVAVAIVDDAGDLRRAGKIASVGIKLNDDVKTSTLTPARSPRSGRIVRRLAQNRRRDGSNALGIGAVRPTAVPSPRGRG